MHLFHEIPKGMARLWLHALRRQCKQGPWMLREESRAGVLDRAVLFVNCSDEGCHPLKGPGWPLLPWTFSDLVIWPGWVSFLRCQNKWPQPGGLETPDIYFSHVVEARSPKSRCHRAMLTLKSSEGKFLLRQEIDVSRLNISPLWPETL